MRKRLHLKYPLFLLNLNFLDKFSKKKKSWKSSFIKIRLLGAEVFHMDGRTWSPQSLFVIMRRRLKKERLFWNKTHHRQNPTELRQAECKDITGIELFAWSSTELHVFSSLYTLSSSMCLSLHTTKTAIFLLRRVYCVTAHTHRSCSISVGLYMKHFSASMQQIQTRYFPAL
jgi:hypothetical protein